jgi:beta-lactamase superfamily II metal-dependent hydrolase
MLSLQMLPAGCGDCLWIEYGPPGNARIVIIDGGVLATASALRHRIAKACHERGVARLDVELLVVTHIDNDHILGIIELLKSPDARISVKDVWFNGRPQLVQLARGRSMEAGARSRRSKPSGNLLGDSTNAERDPDELDDTAATELNLLGISQGDELSRLLAQLALPWNQHACWMGAPIMIRDDGPLPVAYLPGDLRLTLLGPTQRRLRKLCALWSDIADGVNNTSTIEPDSTNLLGRRDTWPPVWEERERGDSSVANGSSIMLLAEYGPHALLLAGDGYAPDLCVAIERLGRGVNGASAPLPIAAFKLPHHGSENNITRRLIETVNCQRYLISTDGSHHGHPDHQALLRILRYSPKHPHLCFNHETDRTRQWLKRKQDVLEAGFQDYEIRLPPNRVDGWTLTLD